MHFNDHLPSNKCNNLDDSSIDISVGHSTENQPSSCVPGRFDIWLIVYFLLLNLIVSVLTYFVMVLVSH